MLTSFTVTRSQMAGMPAPDMLSLWKRVFPGSKPSTYSIRSRIFSQGEPIREAFLPESGVVKLLSTDHDGRETITALRYPGELIEQTATMFKDIYAVSATTVTCCKLSCFDLKRFKQTLRSDIEATNLLLLQQAIESYRNMETLLDLKTLTVRERIVKFLLQFETGAAVPLDVAIKLDFIFPIIREQDIAALLGVTKQHFSTVKGQMIDSGQLAQINRSFALRG